MTVARSPRYQLVRPLEFGLGGTSSIHENEYIVFIMFSRFRWLYVRLFLCYYRTECSTTFKAERHGQVGVNDAQKASNSAYVCIQNTREIIEIYDMHNNMLCLVEWNMNKRPSWISRNRSNGGVIVTLVAVLATNGYRLSALLEREQSQTVNRCCYYCPSSSQQHLIPATSFVLSAIPDWIGLDCGFWVNHGSMALLGHILPFMQ